MDIVEVYVRSQCSRDVWSRIQQRMRLTVGAFIWTKLFRGPDDGNLFSERLCVIYGTCDRRGMRSQEPLGHVYDPEVARNLVCLSLVAKLAARQEAPPRTKSS